MRENELTKIQPHHVRFLAQKLMTGESISGSTIETKGVDDVIAGLVQEKHNFVMLFQHSKDG
jgi:hypothetical protein